MQIPDAAVRLIAWQPVLFLELRAIAARYYTADAELDPVFVLFSLLFCGRSRGFAIACVTGANCGCGTSPSANQHKEFARRFHCTIYISI